MCGPRGISRMSHTAPYAQHMKLMENKTKTRKRGSAGGGGPHTATVAQVLQDHPPAEEP